MQWVSTLSTRPSLEAAIDEVVQRSQDALRSPANLGLVFISSAFASEYSRLLLLLKDRLAGVPMIGCCGGGVVGVNASGQTQEVENEPALSLTLASLPGVNVHTFHLAADELPDMDSAPNAWEALIGVPVAAQPNFILLADSFSSRLNDLLPGLDFAYPTSVKLGGLASTGVMNSNSALFRNYRLYREGSVGVALSGNLVMETIVAQGCRPIGHPYLVTEVDRNIVLALQEEQSDSTSSSHGRSALVSQKRTPLEVLQNLIQTLSESDRALAQNSLFVGVAQNEFKQTLEHGDFLIRNLLGVDPRVGAIAIGDRVRPGQRIQFHLRDAHTSAEDLETLLQRQQQQFNRNAATTIGALMFSCLGRGEGLYGEANFDSRLFHRYLPNIPLSGFFCNGEIGPVGDSTFLHGYTSVFGICRQPDAQVER
jgi:small ligand-binding sensory domain FIST